MYDHCADGLTGVTGDFHGAPNFTNCSNFTVAEPDGDEQWPLERVVSMVVPVFFGLIGLAGLLGNALVILVVVANQQMRSTTNLLIINLAISDILFVIFCVPFTATDYVLPEWPFGNLWCKFVQYMIVVTCHCSVYTLVLMSFDRFLAVVHPVTSMSLRTERNAMLAIVFAWVLIVTTAIPVALSHGVRIYRFRGHNYTACVFSSQQEIWSLVGFQVSFFLSSYVLPLTLISFLYVGMLARLWKSAPGCKPSAESRKGKRRVTRMVVVVVLAFAVCWLPIHVILVLKSLDLYGSSHVTVIIQIVSHVLAYTNSCINPILYAFLSDNFRKAFRKIIFKENVEEDTIIEEDYFEEHIILPQLEANKNRKNSNYQGENTHAFDNVTDIIQDQETQSQLENENIFDAFTKNICAQMENIPKSESEKLMNEIQGIMTKRCVDSESSCVSSL